MERDKSPHSLARQGIKIMHQLWACVPMSERCVYLTEIQLSPQQNYRDLRSAYFVSYDALDFIERFWNGAGVPPRGTILLTVRPVMYVTEHGFALRVD